LQQATRSTTLRRSRSSSAANPATFTARAHLAMLPPAPSYLPTFDVRAHARASGHLAVPRSAFAPSPTKGHARPLRLSIR
jgi:hypothetical protein